jgi:hypothetical protein
MRVGRFNEVLLEYPELFMDSTEACALVCTGAVDSFPLTALRCTSSGVEHGMEEQAQVHTREDLEDQWMYSTGAPL